MILSIDFRTDIPAFYSEWLLNRFSEGYVMFRNPAFPNKVHKVILDNDHIEGIMWCSKNYEPIIPHLHKIHFPSIFHYTVNNFGKEIEPNVPSLDQTWSNFRVLAEMYNTQKVIWRFDPIFYTKDFGEKETLERFENICKRLHTYTDRVVINFCTPYEKVKKHMPEIIFLNDIQKKVLLFNLLGICKEYGLKLQTCGNGLQFKDLEGVEVTGCLDTHALSLMGINTEYNRKATQWGCLCFPNTSIGAYNTCMHKCKYCYASADFEKCEDNYNNNHDPNSPLLIGHLGPDDVIEEMKPKRLSTNQLSLF